MSRPGERGERAPDASIRILRVADADIEERLDHALRELLVRSFPHEVAVLSRSRSLADPPEMRWLATTTEDRPVAHVAVRVRHLRCGRTARRSFACGCLSEVCVLPEYRGRGHARDLLRAAHQWLDDRDVSYALLFGDPAIYRSSGYARAHNLFRYWSPGEFLWIEAPVPSALVRESAGARWPEGPIDVRGVLF